MADISLYYNENAGVFDWEFIGGDIATTTAVDNTSDLESWIIQVLYSDADNKNPTFRDPAYGKLHRGYWGDIFKKYKTGSLLWQTRSMPVTNQTLLFAQNAVKIALKPLLDYKIIGSLIVSCSFFDSGISPASGLFINISTTAPDGSTNQPIKFSYFYKQAYDAALHPVAELKYDTPYFIYDTSFSWDT